MTKNELLQLNIELSIRAQRELDNMADDANVDRFIDRYHIRVEVDPDMIAWQKVKDARAALASIKKEDSVDLMLASAGLVEESDESEVETRLHKIISDNWEAAERWERWTGSKHYE